MKKHIFSHDVEFYRLTVSDEQVHKELETVNVWL